MKKIEKKNFPFERLYDLNHNEIGVWEAIIPLLCSSDLFPRLSASQFLGLTPRADSGLGKLSVLGL